MSPSTCGSGTARLGGGRGARSAEGPAVYGSRVDLPARVKALERVLLDTWPALEARIDNGWVMRANDGVTGRANSLAVLDLGPERPGRLDDVERWYAARGLPTLVRVTPLVEPWLVAELHRRSYTDWPAPTEVMTKLLGDAGGEQASVLSVAEVPDDDWWALTGRSAREREVLEAAACGSSVPHGYVSVRVDGDTVAIGQAAVALSHVAIFSMTTLEAHQGLGLASQVLLALESWGRGLGAHTATLQVTIQNERAGALYRHRGYETLYRYRYLRAPA